jgi:ribosomal protein L11 methyltransferase
VHGDVLLANILADPLIALAPRLTSLVRPGGHLVLSGILTHQAQGVQQAYPAFALSRAAAREDWVCLAGTKK